MTFFGSFVAIWLSLNFIRLNSGPVMCSNTCVGARQETIASIQDISPWNYCLCGCCVCIEEAMESLKSFSSNTCFLIYCMLQ